MRLKIYDASWLIHYGSKSVKYKDFVFAGYPLGGIKFLVKNIAEEIYKNNDIIAQPIKILFCLDIKKADLMRLILYHSQLLLLICYLRVVLVVLN